MIHDDTRQWCMNSSQSHQD